MAGRKRDTSKRQSVRHHSVTPQPSHGSTHSQPQPQTHASRALAPTSQSVPPQHATTTTPSSIPPPPQQSPQHATTTTPSSVSPPPQQPPQHVTTTTPAPVPHPPQPAITMTHSPSTSPSPSATHIAPQPSQMDGQSVGPSVGASIAHSTSTSVEGRLRVTLRGENLEPSGSCSRKIRKIFEEGIDEEGVQAIQWKTVSQLKKKFYWEEFQKSCIWDEAIDALIHAAWKVKAAVRYRDMICDIKKAGKKPKFVNDEVWGKWQDHWKKPEVKQHSEKYSKNRMSQSSDGSGPSTHTGGTATHYDHGRRLAQKLGRQPTATELFVHTHTKKGDGQSFIDKKSKSVHDAIQTRREQMTQSNETVDENNLYLDVVGGRKRSRIYGLGSHGSEFYPSSGASTSGTSHANEQYNEAKIQQLEDQISQQAKVIQELRDFTRDLATQMSNLIGSQRPPAHSDSQCPPNVHGSHQHGDGDNDQHSDGDDNDDHLST